MGLSVAISGGIILTVFVLILLSLPGLVDKMFSIGDISSQVARFDKSISETEISMNHVNTLLNEPTLNFTLRNDGQEKLWNFNDFDLFVTYEGALSGKLTEKITYSGDCLGGLPPQGSWCIESITGDMLDPGILNSAEGANIRVLLNEDMVNVNAIVSISTDNGVTDTVLAPYCGPSCYQMIWNVVADETVINWNNLGPGIEPINNLDNFRSFIDLSDMTEWRLVIHVDNSVGSAACVIGLQYSLDGGATWIGMDNGIANSLSTNTISCDNSGELVTGWNLINVPAQTDVWLRMAGQDNGVPDPTLGTTQVQFRS